MPHPPELLGVADLHMDSLLHEGLYPLDEVDAKFGVCAYLVILVLRGGQQLENYKTGVGNN